MESLLLRLETEEGGTGVGQTDDGGVGWVREDSVALDVGDGTFAVFLHGDVHVGGGHVALPSALLPHSGPAVAFVLLDDVQHLAHSEEAL